MIRLVGSIAVISAGGGWGLIKSSDLSKRVEFLKKTENALLVLQNEITVGGRFLGDILSKCEHPLFKRAAEYIHESGATEGFKKAVSDEKLPSEEENALLSFAEGLAAQGREGQLENIMLCTARIKGIRKEAEEEKAKYGRLYTVTGLLGSIAVVLILI